MLTIIEPYSRAVYQRDNDNKAVIPFRGKATANESVTVTLTPNNGGQLTSMTLEADADGNYSGGIQAVGGWYNATVSSGAERQTNKVGAGEVFICWGHSFMSWPLGSPSTDERVVTLSDTVTQTNNQFEQLTNRVGPFLNDGPGAWGQLGDKLVKRLNVPVMFFGTAFGGSNIDQNYDVINNIPFEHGFIKYSERMPYRPLEKVMTDYIPRTGIRAVLCEHGYNDVHSDTQKFIDEYNAVIDYTRNHFGNPDLAFVMVQEETTGQADRLGSAAIGNAEKTIIGIKPNTWKGPDFNAGYWGTPGFHDVDRHLTVAGNAQFSSDWDASLTNTFFSQSKPVLSKTAITSEAVDVSEIGDDYAAAPEVQTEGVSYIIYALGALFLLGLINGRTRSKSLVGLLILAVIFIYRSQKSNA